MDVLVSGDQVGAFGDARGRLQLVPRQHPDLSGRYTEDKKRFCSLRCAQVPFFPLFLHLDASVPEQLQGGPDVRLQLVLHARQTEELHLPLEALHHRRHLQGSVMDAQLGLVVAALRAEAEKMLPRRANLTRRNKIES